ncbi:unnamed protein product [Fraxinus pennsylvanica]|uniref:Lipoyl-binding domain-containing protein n=1 Tax=Fraxinus pennsylvanica TaxID=56036 RepID=A0AAD2E2M2_9LAMI|nr:unnamed protein product [Fraxinus pennsylvanica]
MASSSSSFPDVYAWLENLPPIPQWKTDSMSMNICPFSSIPSLKLSVKNYNSSFSLSIYADYNLPLSLWNSKTFSPNPISNKLLDDHETVSGLFLNFIENILMYSPNRSISSNSLYSPNRSISSNSLRLPRSTYSENNFKDLFNFSFLSLTFIICIYEAPTDIRSSCLSTLKDQFACPKSREVSKILMRSLGSNIEEHWMRSINLAITNWVTELQGENTDCTSSNCKTPSPLFSYSFSTYGLWKVQLYCPVISMEVEKSSSPSPDEHLLFSLNYHQLEGVIQLNHRAIIQEKWIEVRVNIDNIRCDVMKLVTDKLMKERGAGTSEKHFPSRIALQITPTMQANIISISVSKSTENPAREIGVEKSIEASFEPPNPHMGINFSAGETMTISLKPWKFEQSVHGNTAILNWFLHDSVNGREVFSSRPSKFALLQPKAWFKHRYSNAYRPFTRQGGVVFAGDEYGESVSWKVDKACMEESMEWQIKGWIWLTYWPNKHRTLYTETRRSPIHFISSIQSEFISPMESAAVLRSFHYSVGTSSHLKSVLEQPGTITMNNASLSNLKKLPFYGGKNMSLTNKRGAILVPFVKASESTGTAKSSGDPNNHQNGSVEKKSLPATFPNGFETLLTEVCEETKVAELKIKFGDFQMHVKRKIEPAPTPAPIVSPTSAPPVPSEPMNESAPAAAPPSPSKSSEEKISPFTNVSADKAAKLAALEASGSSGYVILSSPQVGSFRRARTLKGKKQPPACKEGDVIKEGQIVGFLDQFGTELPVRSDVAGEVLKLLYDDGEAVGYGDPLVAVLPSFHELGDSCENSSVSKKIPVGRNGTKTQNISNSRKRKLVRRGNAKEIPAIDANVASENSESSAKRSKSDDEGSIEKGNAKKADVNEFD